MNTINRMSSVTRYNSVFDEEEEKPNDSRAEEFAELFTRARHPTLQAKLSSTMDESHTLPTELTALLKAMLEEAFFCSLSGKPAKRLKLRLTNGPFAGLLIEAEQEENSPHIMIHLFPDSQHSQRFLRAFGCGAELAASLSEMFRHPITIDVRDPASQAKFNADPSIK